MELTAYEQEMLDGKYGEGYQLAMEVLVQMGELYGAKRFLPVRNAHIDAAAYTTIWDAGTEFLEFLAAHDVKVPQPTTINPLSEEGERWKHQIFVTNSGKVAQYAPGINHCFIKMATTAGCVESAVSGRFPEEVH